MTDTIIETSDEYASTNTCDINKEIDDESYKMMSSIIASIYTSYDRCVHYRKYPIEFSKDGVEFTLTHNEKNTYVSDIIISTQNNSAITFDEMMNRIKKIKMFINEQQICELTGNNLLTICKLEHSVYNFMIDRFISNNTLIIPIHRIINSNTQIMMFKNRIIKIICMGEDDYNVYCFGYCVGNKYISGEHDEMPIKQYDVFQIEKVINFTTNENNNLNKMKIFAIIISVNDGKDYEISINNIKFLKGDDPMIQINNNNLDHDKYYYLSVIDNHISQSGGLLYDVEKISFAQECPRAEIIICSHKNIKVE